MLDLMRKHAKNWVMKLLLGIIIVVFIFYFGSLRDRDRADSIAIFDGKAISYADFQREYQNLIDLYRNRFGGNLTEEMIKGLKLKEQATDNLVRQAIILAKADELNVRVSDEDLRNSILTYPAFQRNGVFDQHVYEDTLRQNKMTPENFENMQRKVVITGKIQDLILSGVHVSDREVLDIYRMQKEKINVKFIKFSSKDYRDEVKPTREALEAYFKEHRDEFRMPEQIQVRYLSFMAADYSANTKVTEEDIKDFYERNKQGLSKNGGKPPSLAEVSEKIASALRQRAGMSRAAEEARKAREVIYQQENFDAYAGSKGLRVQTSALFPASSIPPEFRSLTDFSKNVFALQKNEVSRVLFDDKGYYLFQVASRKPSYLPDLKEAEKEVASRYGEKEANTLCQKEAETLLERLKKGEAWEKIAKEKKGAAGETGLIVPGSDIPGLGVSEQLTDALSQLSEAKPYPSKVLRGNGNSIILRFKERGKIDEGDFHSQKAELKKLVQELKKSETVNAWLEGIKASLIKEGRLKITKDVKDT
jgi:peptidyl-prolyl cis-trans isomerase D